MINFARTDDPETLGAALAALEAGEFDWLTVTSATTVDVLSAHRIRIPERRSIAAVGETTAAALTAAGYSVDLVPAKDNSAKGMVQELTALEQHREARSSRSAVGHRQAAPHGGPDRRGHDVESVVAYRTVGVPVAERSSRDVASGRVRCHPRDLGQRRASRSVRSSPASPRAPSSPRSDPRTAVDAEATGCGSTSWPEQQRSTR